MEISNSVFVYFVYARVQVSYRWELGFIYRLSLIITDYVGIVTGYHYSLEYTI